MTKKIRNTALILIVCLLIAAQNYLMPKVVTESSKPPLRTEPQTTTLVFPVPSTINIQSNLMKLRMIFKGKATYKSDNTFESRLLETDGLDSINQLHTPQ